MSAFFPGAVATQLQLLTAQNNSMVILDANCDLDDDVITVDDASALPASGYLTFVDTDEVIYYTSKTSNTLTGVIRGADSTTAASHLAGVDLEQRWNADYHNILTLEMVAIEQFISDKIGISATQVVAPAGSVSAPAYTTLGDLDTGLYHSGANTLDIATAGTRAATWNSSQQLLIYKTSNQLILGTTNTVTISSTAPASSRTYTIPDAGGAANFLLSGWAQIVNADVSASAALAYSKLALTGSIVNADVSASAAIAYSKLALTGAILNADLAGSIAYSKLSLTGAILNADLAGSIARNKLVALTVSRAMVTDGSGFDTVATTTATEIGYVNGVTSAIQTQLDAKAALAGATFTGDVIIDNQHIVKFREASGGGTNFFGIKAAAAMSADVTVLLPSAAPTANLQVLRVSDYTTGALEWGTGSGAGGINYITNTDAESDASTWTTYADAAATTPVDGTGGSPSATFARNTSSPLRGTGMFTLTKGATNRQGDGVGYAFTIDAADKASVQQISFDYQVSSAFVAGDSSDVRIFIYDVTNAVLITPAPYTLQGGNGTPHKFVSTFQTASNSTSYRLIFHIATTNASAWTMDFDNVKVGPQLSAWGPPVSDWTSYTPTGAWNTNVTYTAMWRRVGDSMEVIFKITCSGAPNSASASVTLPTGYTIDTTKLMGSSSDESPIQGTVQIIDSGNNFYTGRVVYKNTTEFKFRTQDDAAGGVILTSLSEGNPITFGNLDYISGWARFPIVGWGSNVQMSNDTDTRVVFARYSTTAAQSMTADTDTLVNFDTKEYDTHGAVTTGVGSWKFTAPVTGYYRITTIISFTGASSAVGGAHGNNIQIQLYKNGSSTCMIGQNTIETTTSVSWRTFGSSVIQLNAGDTCAAYLHQDTNSSQTLSASATVNWITIERISGPSTIAATETVSARYTTAAGQTVTSSDVQVNYGTKDFDTHGAVTTGAGSWKFTAPVSGRYLVKAQVFGSAITPVADTASIALSLYKNGSQVSTAVTYGKNTTTTEEIPLLVDVVRLLPGDTIDVRVGHTGSISNYSLLANALYNFISIDRIGNY